MGKIYKITNQVNGKIYVGQTISTLEERFASHCNDAQWGRTNQLLHQAIRKYGAENFIIELIEECEDSLLNEREIYWIKELNSVWGYDNLGYNMTEGGGGVPGYRHTEETKAKIALSQIDAPWHRSPERRLKLGKTLKGRVFTEEHKKKISESRKGKFTKEQNGFYGKKHSEETKKKLSEARKGKISSVAQAIMVMDLEGNDIKEFPSIKQCYEWLYEEGYTTNTNYRSVTTQIKDMLRGKQTKAFGFTYRLIDKV